MSIDYAYHPDGAQKTPSHLDRVTVRNVRVKGYRLKGVLGLQVDFKVKGFRVKSF